jgi:uncharacterized spore protein YtfJ
MDKAEIVSVFITMLFLACLVVYLIVATDQSLIGLISILNFGFGFTAGMAIFIQKHKG